MKERNKNAASVPGDLKKDKEELEDSSANCLPSKHEDLSIITNIHARKGKGVASVALTKEPGCKTETFLGQAQVGEPLSKLSGKQAGKAQGSRDSANSFNY